MSNLIKLNAYSKSCVLKKLLDIYMFPIIIGHKKLKLIGFNLILFILNVNTIIRYFHYIIPSLILLAATRNSFSTLTYILFYLTG